MIPRWARMILAGMLLAGAHSAWSGEDPELAKLRKLAASMLKRSDLGGTGAYCEYAPTCQVDGCSGPGRNALRHIARPNGMIESWYYRSPGESGEPIGRYQGKMKKGQWTDLLRKLARMRHDAPAKGASGPPLPPPPGPLESIQQLLLTDGKASASYSFAGHASASIETAFNQFGILAQAETDTLWELSLPQPKALIRKDSVVVTARWKWRGPAGARVLFSESAGGEYCGKARFKWYLDTSSFTADWQHSEAAPGPGRTLAWTLAPAVRSDDAPAFSLAFPYAGPGGPPGKAKRMGMMDGIGIRLIPPGSSDTISATVFTDPFPF